jgi:hypothetical protein
MFSNFYIFNKKWGRNKLLIYVKYSLNKGQIKGIK